MPSVCGHAADQVHTWWRLNAGLTAMRPLSAVSCKMRMDACSRKGVSSNDNAVMPAGNSVSLQQPLQTLTCAGQDTLSSLPMKTKLVIQRP